MKRYKMRERSQRKFAEAHLLGSAPRDDRACADAIDWLKNECTVNGVCDLRVAWERCNRGDWMEWALEEMATKDEWDYIDMLCDCAFNLAGRKPRSSTYADEIRKRIACPWGAK